MNKDLTAGDYDAASIPDVMPSASIMLTGKVEEYPAGGIVEMDDYLDRFAIR